MIYLVLFSLSAFFVSLLNQTKGLIRSILLLFSILLPSILFGLRSTSMGIDTQVYVEPIWNIAQSVNSFDFGDSHFAKAESGYLFLNYVLSSCFDDIHWLYFTIAFVSCSAVLMALLKSEFADYAWLGYTYYLFLFIPSSVNLIRQGPSNALLFVACIAFLQEKWKKFLSFVLLATLLHNSALIALSFLVIYYVLKKNEKKGMLVMIGVALFCSVCGQIVFSKFAMFNEKYLIYVNGSFSPHFTIFSLVFIPFVILFALYYESFKKMFPYTPLVLIMLIYATIFYQLSWIVSVYLARVADPYKYFGIVAVMMILKWVKEKNRKNLHIVTYALIVYALMYFWLAFNVAKQGGVIPYKSEIVDGIIGGIL